MTAGCDRCGTQVDTGRSGIATLVLGTKAVAAPAVTANSIIQLTVQPTVAPLAICWISSVTPGTGFTITSLNLTDTCKVGWTIWESNG